MARRVRVSLPRLKRVTNRLGAVFVYYRRPGGALAPLPPEDDPGFYAAYARLAAEDGKPVPPKPRAPKSLGDLWARYRVSPEFMALAQVTRENRAAIIVRIVGVVAPDGRAVEDMPVAAIGPEDVAADLARRAPTRSAAYNRLKAWRALLDHAVALKWIAANPARAVTRTRPKAEPYRAWAPEDVAAFRARWPLGSQQRLALELLYDHAPRRADLVALGRQHLRQGRLSWRQSKTGTWTTPRALGPNAAAAIAAFLERRPGVLTFLETAQGRARSADAFGEWFRSACRAAGLEGLSAHGLRHTMGREAAEEGVPDAGLAQLLGHRSEGEARTYRQQAEAAKLAEAAETGLAKRRGKARD